MNSKQINQNDMNNEVSMESLAKAIISVRTDVYCTLLCDGDDLGIQLEARRFAKIQVPIGQHLFEFVSKANPDVILEKTVDFPEATKCYLVIVRELMEAESDYLEKCEPYATLSDDKITLSFYFDDKKNSRKEVVFGLEPDEEEGKNAVNPYQWGANADEITTVVFEESFAKFHTICSTKRWFLNMRRLKMIIGLNNLDTSKVTDMSGMFCGCRALQSLELTGFDTRNVTDMSRMFEGCENLASLDVGDFDTSKVTDMHSMFEKCLSLESLYVNNFDTSKVTDMSWMFRRCSDLESLDLSCFVTINVSNMSGMFYNCNVLKSLELDYFESTQVTDMHSMFEGCNSLESLDVSSFDTSKVTNMERMFSGCVSLESLDVSNFDFGNVTSKEDMFLGIDSSIITMW